MAGDIRIKYVSGVVEPPMGDRILVCGGKVRRGTDPDAPNEVVCGVGGELDNGTDKVVGRTVMFCYRNTGKVGSDGKATPKAARWLIVFRLPDGFSGASTLTVRGFVLDGTPPANRTRRITIPAPSPALAPPIRPLSSVLSVDLMDPPGGDRPTAEAEFFVATGLAFQSHTVVSAKMNDVDAEYMGTEDGIWAVVFPPLPTEDESEPIDYLLLVEDNAAHSVSRGYVFRDG